MSFEVVAEQNYTIPFYPKLNSTPRNKRAPRAMRIVREFITRHMKSDDIVISEEVNQAIWARGIQKPPRKISVRAVKHDDGYIEVHLISEKAYKDFIAGDVPIQTEPTESDIDEEEFDEDED